MTLKANIWVIEFIVALVVFSTVAFIVFSYNQNLFEFIRADEDRVIDDANRLTDGLLTPGVPLNWSEAAKPGDVLNIGLTTEDFSHLNTSKLMALRALINGSDPYFAIESYEEVRGILGTTSNFIIFFEDNDLMLMDFDEARGFGRFTGDMRLGGTDIYYETNETAGALQVSTIADLDRRLTENDVSTIIKTYRFVFHDKKILRMGVYAWV